MADCPLRQHHPASSSLRLGQPPTLQSMQQPHYSGLDGLRALAVLAVIAVHVEIKSLAGYGVDWLTYITTAGWVGVDLFFVISGLLITGILLRTKGIPRYYRKFFWHRILRIVPVYIAFLIVLCLALPLTGVPIFKVTTPDRYTAWSAAGYYYNLRDPFIEAGNKQTVFHFWSLCVEWHFYLIWPIIVTTCTSKSLRIISGVGIIVCLVLRSALFATGNIEAALILTPCRLDCLFAGAVVAASLHDGSLQKLQQPAKLSVLLGGVCVAAIAIRTGHFSDCMTGNENLGLSNSRYVATAGITALSFLFGGLVCLVVIKSPRFLTNPALESIGRCSYGIYIVHLLVIVLTSWSFGKFIPGYVNWVPWKAKLLPFFLVSGVSYCIAWVSFYGFERRFLVMKQKF